MFYIFQPKENVITPIASCDCKGINTGDCTTQACSCNTGYCSGCQVPIGGGGISRIPAESI